MGFPTSASPASSTRCSISAENDRRGFFSRFRAQRELVPVTACCANGSVMIHGTELKDSATGFGQDRWKITSSSASRVRGSRNSRFFAEFRGSARKTAMGIALVPRPPGTSPSVPPVGKAARAPLLYGGCRATPIAPADPRNSGKSLSWLGRNPSSESRTLEGQGLPSSDEILQLTSTWSLHPLARFLQHGASLAELQEIVMSLVTPELKVDPYN